MAKRKYPIIVWPTWKHRRDVIPDYIKSNLELGEAFCKGLCLGLKEKEKNDELER